MAVVNTLKTGVVGSIKIMSTGSAQLNWVKVHLLYLLQLNVMYEWQRWLIMVNRQNEKTCLLEMKRKPQTLK